MQLIDEPIDEPQQIIEDEESNWTPNVAVQPKSPLFNRLIGRVAHRVHLPKRFHHQNNKENVKELPPPEYLFNQRRNLNPYFQQSTPTTQHRFPHPTTSAYLPSIPPVKKPYN